MFQIGTMSILHASGLDKRNCIQFLNILKEGSVNAELSQEKTYNFFQENERENSNMPAYKRTEQKKMTQTRKAENTKARRVAFKIDNLLM